MKVKLTDAVLDYEGNKIFTNEEKTTFINFRTLIDNSLNAQLKDEEQTSEVKAKIFALTLKIYAKAEVELTLDELSLIKERADKVLLPLYHGRLLQVIDPTTDKK